MHELKTPLMKGKFLLELPNNDSNKHKMSEVFSRLELLISEFAGIEELMNTSNEDKILQTDNYHIQDLIENAIDLLMKDENIEVDESLNKIYNVNFKLFSIVIKNLIDNALKYSTNTKVQIISKDDNLTFKNRGEKLQYQLEEYFQPFFNNSNNTNNSFGLGLYIVDYILRAHNMRLEYKHEKGYNYFSIHDIH